MKVILNNKEYELLVDTIKESGVPIIKFFDYMKESHIEISPYLEESYVFEYDTKLVQTELKVYKKYLPTLVPMVKSCLTLAKTMFTEMVDRLTATIKRKKEEEAKELKFTKEGKFTAANLNEDGEL